MTTALILSGGGARAAYQVGVLKAVGEMLPTQGRNPFPILCGTSSGALNAARLACHAENFAGGVHALELIWSELRSRQVHRVGYRYLFKSLAILLASFVRSGKPGERSLALFDNAPLKDMLAEHIDLHRIGMMIDEGHLHALCITALGYTSGQNLCFFQGHESIPDWFGSKRKGLRCEIGYEHILASMALPMLFPAVKINREYFGDGALRQTSPMSAALHLGAKKLLVIGVAGGSGQVEVRERAVHSPSLAQVMGQLINSAFIDSLEEDIEMLQRFNGFAYCLNESQRDQLHVRPVEILRLEPTVKFDQLASRYADCLPPAMQTLLRITGANLNGSSNLASYILFEKEYCQELIRAGYADAMHQSRAILEFLEPAHAASFADITRTEQPAMAKARFF